MTKIEWTDETWNPVVGCSVVSPGCTNCYAMRLAGTRLKDTDRYFDLTTMTNAGPVWNGKIRWAGNVEAPLRWRKPRMVFVNSMGDLFHENMPLPWIKEIWQVMHEAHKRSGHIFQVLTKRPERIAPALGPDGIGWYAAEGPVPCPEPGIWLGTSIERRQEGEARAWHLANAPAAVRFWSVEPLLDDLGDLTSLCLRDTVGNGDRAVHWVIVGGESGPNARPMNPDWARSIRDQCQAAGVPFFMKQMTRKAPIPDDLRIREWPEAA